MSPHQPPESDRTDAPPRAPEESAGQASTGRAVRKFARFQLLRLLGKSERSMAWAAIDGRDDQEYILMLPRAQRDPAGMSAWQQAVRRAARLNHPHLARLVESGEFDRWPYALYDRAGRSLWLERFSRQGLPAQELADWAAQAAQGLAYAHEAGVAHHDLQPWSLTIDDAGQVQVLGLEVAGREVTAAQDGAMEEMRAVRDAAQRDVMSLGLVLMQGLVGQPTLDEPDLGRVIDRMPPRGPEIVRLPWALPRPVPDPLRAIVNRAVDRQVRQRYQNARTLQRALEGWLKTLADKDGGPLALLMDRLRTVGALPAQPGGAERVAHLALMERSRTNELAEVVISDIALTFELLRVVNTAQVHGSEVGSDSPVLMLRRAIAMVGLEGVRRAALGLRAWPGPMDEAAATEMETLIRRVHRAARVAVRLAPAGYDGEVVYLIALMQNLGRLLVQYHFPEESVQIRRLMAPADAGVGQGDDPGMSADAASFAVLGIDVEELGVAVAQYWGLGDSVLSMIRRLPATSTVHPPGSDQEILKLTASCANDLIDAMQLPQKRAAHALRQVAQRYGRALGLTGRDMQEALQIELDHAPATLSNLGGTATRAAPAPVAPVAAVAAPAGAGGAAPAGGPVLKPVARRPTEPGTAPAGTPSARLQRVGRTGP